MAKRIVGFRRPDEDEKEKQQQAQKQPTQQGSSSSDRKLVGFRPVANGQQRYTSDNNTVARSLFAAGREVSPTRLESSRMQLQETEKALQAAQAKQKPTFTSSGSRERVTGTKNEPADTSEVKRLKQEKKEISDRLNTALAYQNWKQRQAEEEEMAGWNLGERKTSLDQTERQLTLMQDPHTRKLLDQEITAAKTRGDTVTAKRLEAHRAAMNVRTEELQQEYRQKKNEYDRALGVQYDRKWTAQLDTMQQNDTATWSTIDAIAREMRKETASDSTHHLRQTEADPKDVEPADVVALKKQLQAAGIKAADIDELVEMRVRQLDNERFTAMEERARELAQAAPVAASIGSVATNAASGLGYVAALAEKVRHPDRPTNYNAPEMLASGATSAIRGQVSQDIQDNAKSEFGGKAGSFMYQTLMSAADSGVNMLLVAGGLPEPVGLAIMASGAATNTLQEAHDRGLSDNQALTLGLISGTAEYLTERIGMDAFMDTVFKGKGASTALKSLATNVFAEGGEEVLSDVINFMGEALVAKDQSKFRQNIQHYRGMGYSDSEATGLAVKDQLSDTALSFLGGALAGGLMGGTGVVLNNAVNARAEEMWYGAQSLAAEHPAKIAADQLTAVQQEIAQAVEARGDREMTEAESQRVREAADTLQQEVMRLSDEERKELLETGRTARKLVQQAERSMRRGVKRESAQPTVVYSQNTTVQKAAEQFATGDRTKIAKAVSTVFRSKEAQSALGLSFGTDTDNTTVRTAIKDALGALVREGQTQVEALVQQTQRTAPVTQQAAVEQNTDDTTAVSTPEGASISYEEFEQQYLNVAKTVEGMPTDKETIRKRWQEFLDDSFVDEGGKTWTLQSFSDWYKENRDAEATPEKIRDIFQHLRQETVAAGVAKPTAEVYTENVKNSDETSGREENNGGQEAGQTDPENNSDGGRRAGERSSRSGGQTSGVRGESKRAATQDRHGRDQSRSTEANGSRSVEGRGGDHSGKKERNGTSRKSAGRSEAVPAQKGTRSKEESGKARKEVGRNHEEAQRIRSLNLPTTRTSIGPSYEPVKRIQVNHLTDAMQKMVRLGRKVGVRVWFVLGPIRSKTSSATNINGMFAPGQIIVRADSETQSMWTTFFHEFFHAVIDRNPDTKASLLDRLSENGVRGEDLDRLVRAGYLHYESLFGEFTEENAWLFYEELLADCCAMKQRDGVNDADLAQIRNVIWPVVNEIVAGKRRAAGSRSQEKVTKLDLDRADRELSQETPTKDSTGKSLTDEQRTFFVRSKARNDRGFLLRVYHGTGGFGFVVFDPQESDDHLCLFFTDSPVVAQSYMSPLGKPDDYKYHIPRGGTAQDVLVHPLFGAFVDEATKRYDQQMEQFNEDWLRIYPDDRTDASNAEFVERYADMALEFLRAKGFEIGEVLPLETAEAELEEVLVKEVNDAYDALDKLYDLYAQTFGDEESDQAWGELLDMYSDAEDMEAYNTFLREAKLKALDEWAGTAGDPMLAPSFRRAILKELNALRQLHVHDITFTGNQIAGAADRVLNDGTDPGVKLNKEQMLGTFRLVKHPDPAVGITLFNNAKLCKTAEDVSRELSAKAGLGIYETYLNLENPLIIDAHGRSWSNLDRKGFSAQELEGQPYWEGELNPHTGTITTRSVARYAYDNGYDGVIFKNLVDMGTYSQSRTPSTVLIAFYSNQVKDTDNTTPTKDPDYRYSFDPADATDDTQNSIDGVGVNTTSDEGAPPPSREDLARMVHRLTGKPLSKQYVDAVFELLSGRQITVEQYNAIPEIQMAKERVKAAGEPTRFIDTPERDAKRKQWTRDLLRKGSASGVNERGETIYEGGVARNRRLDIVIGLPAAGKSSAVVDPLSNKYKSRVLDSDDAKQMIPEFDDGWGAGRVHKESQEIMWDAYSMALYYGDNIVVPIVGASVKSVEKYIKKARLYGYDVYLELNDLNPNKAAGRNMMRFASDGRFLDLEVTSFKYENGPKETFEWYKRRYENAHEGTDGGGTAVSSESEGDRTGGRHDRVDGGDGRRSPLELAFRRADRQRTPAIVDGYVAVSNDVKRGEKPKHISGTMRLDFGWKDRVKKEQANSKNAEAPGKPSASSTGPKGKLSFDPPGISTPKFSYDEQLAMTLAGKMNRHVAAYADANGKIRTSSVYVSYETPEALAAINMQDLPILVTQKHLRDANQRRVERADGSPVSGYDHYHGITEDKLKKLPELLRGPALLIKDARVQSNDVIVVTTEKDYRGRQIIVTIHPNGTAVYDGVEGPANFITSIYGFGKRPTDIRGVIELAVKQGRVLYAHKERSQEIMSTRNPQQTGWAFDSLTFDTVLGQIADPAGGKPTRKFDMEKTTKEQPKIDTFAEMVRRAEAAYDQAQTEATTHPVTARDLGSIAQVDNTVAAWIIYRHKYGDIPQTGSNFREVAVPARTAADNRVSKTASTVMGAEITSEERLKDIASAVVGGKLSYIPVTDKIAENRARAKIDKEGFQAARINWTKAISEGKVNKDLVAMGATLLNNAGNSNASGTEYVGILTDYADLLRHAGQALQAAKILKKLSPEAKLYAAQSQVDRINDELAKRGLDPTQYPGVTIDQALIDAWRRAKTDAERDEIMEQIAQNIADQIPPTAMDKFTAWRYLAMLGNFRTQVRNILGNTMMQPMRMLKSDVAGLAEAMIQRMGGRIDRTTSVLRDRETFKAAFEDYNHVREMILGGGKYDDSKRFAREIEEKRRIFKSKLLEGYRKATNWAMDTGDSVFCSFTYADALARYIKANGEKWSTASEELKDRAREYAIREAAEATYRDNNAFSDLIVRARIRNPDNAVKKAAAAVIEGVLPFRKTPANILVRTFEYSPVGLLHGAYSLAAKAVGKGNVTGAEIVNQLAKGLTGSGLLYLGFALAAQGLLTGKAPDDDKEKEQWKREGHQAYALEVNGYSYTLDWMAPTCVPLFLGANLQEALLAEGLTLESALDAMKTITDPVLEMSMLQGIQDLIDNAANYGDDSALVRLTTDALWSYVSQVVPTVLGQAERAADNRRMQTYTDKNSPLPTDWQYATGKLSAKIPGWDYAQIVYTDAWGRTHNNAETATLNVLQQLFSPGYGSKVETSDMERELLRLYEATGNSGVLISNAQKYIEVDGERKNLTGDEFLTYNTTRGQTAYQVLTELTQSAAYQRMSDDTKADVVKKVYEYATQVSKDQVDDRFEADKWVINARNADREIGMTEAEFIAAYITYGSKLFSGTAYDKMKDALRGGVTLDAYARMRAGLDTDGSGSVTPAEARSYLDSANLPQAQKALLWGLINSSWKTNPYS